MGKLTTYLIIMMGISALFYFTGLTRDCNNEDGTVCSSGEGCLCIDKTPSSALLNLVLKTMELTDKENTNSLFSRVSLVLSGITAAALLGASFLYRDIKLAILGPLASYLLLFLSDFIVIIAKIWSVHYLAAIFVTLLVSPLLAYYIIVIVEWWGGTD